MNTDTPSQLMLSASVSKDLRGLGLIEVYISTYTASGLPRYGRVNTFGGITYVPNPKGGRFKEPTLLLSENEAKLLLTELHSHFFGPMVSRDDLDTVVEQRDELERQNQAMRVGKKKVEEELRDVKNLRNLLRALLNGEDE